MLVRVCRNVSVWFLFVWEATCTVEKGEKYWTFFFIDLYTTYYVASIYYNSISYTSSTSVIIVRVMSFVYLVRLIFGNFYYISFNIRIKKIIFEWICYFWFHLRCRQMKKKFIINTNIKISNSTDETNLAFHVFFNLDIAIYSYM